MEFKLLRRELLKLLVLGTERSVIDVGVSSWLTEAGVPTDTTENQLLGGLVLLDLLHRTAIEQSGDPPAFRISEPDTAEVIAWDALPLFQQLASGRLIWLEDIAIDMLVVANKVLPPRLLPHYLDIAARQPARRQLLLTVAGWRGQYLSKLNPAWKPMTVEIDLNTWRTATTDQQRDWFINLRLTNAPFAFDLLADIWHTEVLQQKLRWLELLRFHPSAVDVPFLRQLLLVREHPKVQSIALRFLLLLGDKEWELRMEKMLRATLTVQDGNLNVHPTKAQHIDLDLFNLIRPIEKKEKQDASLAIATLCGYSSPKFFNELYNGLPPESILKRLSIQSDMDEYASALVQSAIRHEDENWHCAILAWWMEDPDLSMWQNLPMHTLATKINLTTIDLLIIENLKSYGGILPTGHPLLVVLIFNQHIWSAPLAKAILFGLCDVLDASSGFANPIATKYRDVLKKASANIPSDLCDDLRKKCPEGALQNYHWKRELNQFFDALKFRQSLSETLK